MPRTLRYVIGWLLAAAAAVGLAWTVIADAIGTGGPSTPIAAVTVGAGSPPPLPDGSAAQSPTQPAAPSATVSGPVGTGPTGTGPGGSGPAGTGPGRTGSGGTGSGSSASGSSASGGTGSGDPGQSVRQNAPATGAGTAGSGSPNQSGATVRPVRVTGGQVVLQLLAGGARVLSATPAAGYEVQSWQAQGWLRVDFRAGGHTSSVFVTWNGHPPSVQTAES